MGRKQRGQRAGKRGLRLERGLIQSIFVGHRSSVMREAEMDREERGERNAVETRESRVERECESNS